MSDFPSQTASPLAIHTYTFNAGASGVRNYSALGAGARTWVANLAIYIPVLVMWPYTVQRVFWVNGSTITSTSADFGIYTAEGTRIYSTGSTAMAGASDLQFVTPTAFTLSPGAYYFGWSCNNTTNRAYGGAPPALGDRLGGVLAESSAFPLPATMTPAAVANPLYPLCGVTRTTSGF